MNYCKRCGFTECICLKDKTCDNNIDAHKRKVPKRKHMTYNCFNECKDTCKVPCNIGHRPRENPQELAMRYIMYTLLQKGDCKINKNTCETWFEPYYGSNQAFLMQYIMNTMCR